MTYLPDNQQFEQMKLLRKTIQKLILEAYELTDKDIKRYRGWNRGEGKSDEEIRQTVDDRGIGMQNKKAIQRDKKVMRDWHELMKQNPHFVKQFMEGKVQILHSITYQGLYSDKDQQIESSTPFSNWIKKFGRTSRDQISCVAANAPIGADPHVQDWDEGNAGDIYSGGFGFLMKGYPAFAAALDVMSQTLSAISDDLKDFHKNSGQVKRAGPFADAIDPNNWKGVDELILDNWKIIGIYILDYYWDIEEGDAIIADAYEQGVPVYKVDSKTYKMAKV